MIRDPFDGTEAEQPDCRPTFHLTENKYPTSRALAAAFWASYFALHWLMLLDMIELTTARVFATIFFLVSAVLLTLLIATNEVKR